MSRAGIFGWSYPPGCSGPPDDGPEPPCQLCGEDENSCKCQECPADNCGTFGCIEHMGISALLLSAEKLNYLANARNVEIKRRSMAEAVTCEKCQAKIPKDFFEGLHWCDNCGALVGQAKGDDFS